ncbi:MAG: NACHT domain-containing protein [Candidatus Omnitrophica bacterium]|nr:NACHT domain-containing protein [Candidatus Omnitrophota bacterium]
MLTLEQKLRFINGIADEKTLREDILMPLFRAKNCFHRVVSTHGIDEKGKDIVLVNKDPLGELSYTAVIVKNEAITNAASKKDKEIVANVMAQITMTINSGYDCIEKNENVNFNKILIITSKAITNSARAEFVKMVKDQRFPAIAFWDEARLVEEFDKCLPDIYCLSRGGLSRYFYSLRAMCEKLNELKNISIYQGEVKNIADVFVEPTLKRKVDKILDAKPRRETETTTITKIVGSGHSSLIYGMAGAGKSTLLRSEMFRMILDYENKKNNKVPIYIKVKEFASQTSTENTKDVRAALVDYMVGKFNLSEEDVESVFRSKEDNFFLFMDGYDELSSAAERKHFDAFLEAIGGEENISYILTSRKRIDFVSLREKKVDEWDIADFNMSQIRNFFKKWLHEKCGLVLEALQDHNLINQLPHTPLTMTLVAIIFDADNNVELPSNLSELYKMFTDLLIGRWSLDRTASNFYQANDKETYLTEVALFLHEHNRIACSREEIIKTFHKTDETLGRPTDHANMFHELTVNTNLLLENDKGEFEFRHLSFQEFFVANDYLNRNKSKFLLEKFPNSWWDQVLYFYAGIKKTNEDLFPKLIKKTVLLEPMPKIMAIWQVGYLVQSSYKTRASVREKIISVCAYEYAKSMPVVIKDYLERNKTMTEMLAYLSIGDMFIMHFKSKFLVGLIKKVYRDLLKAETMDFPHTLSLFLICVLLGELGESDYMLENDKHFKKFPILELLEGIHLKYNLSEIAADKEEKKRLRQMAGKIVGRFKKNPEAYRRYLGIKPKGMLGGPK